MVTCVLHAAEVGGSVDCPLVLMWTLAPFVFRCHVVMMGGIAVLAVREGLCLLRHFSVVATNTFMRLKNGWAFFSLSSSGVCTNGNCM